MSKQAVTHRLKQMEGLWHLSKALADAQVVHKNGSDKNRGLEIQSAIRRILLLEWNPRAAGRDEDVDRSYDHHIAPILRILVGCRSLDDLVECLIGIGDSEAGDGAGVRNVDRLRQMANRLLEVDVKLS